MIGKANRSNIALSLDGSDEVEVDLFLDVEARIKKKNKLFFSRGSLCLEKLKIAMDIQNHRVLVLWALDCGQEALRKFEAFYPREARPRRALELCDAWARGDIKMAEAKRGILEAHAVTKEIKDPSCIALCHGIGHAGATVHAGAHALGLPIYELTSIVLDNGLKNYEEDVRDKIDYYLARLEYWRENEKTSVGPWAKFLL